MLSITRLRFLHSHRYSIGLYTSKRLYTSQQGVHQTQKQTNHPPLRVFNSLTKSKTSIEASVDQPLKWYSCGPTVYDASHIGHARNYVSQDIIRRILTDYFGYNVHFVMNVTDIDDKIITRTRENVFIEKFATKHHVLSDSMILEITELLQDFIQRTSAALPAHLRSSREGHWSELFNSMDSPEYKDVYNKEEKLKLHLSSAKRCFDGLVAARSQLDSGATGHGFAMQLINESRDILGPMLNAKWYSEKIHPGRYKQTATVWENRFFQDMARLNVLPPDTVTRASEHVPEIIDFIEGILNKGYAYVSNGSVYFDAQAFGKSGDHQSRRLLPVNVPQSINCGSESGFGKEKKSPSDFSLWKATKEGEPSWESPWGAGRPGWHIECSAMASSIFGEHLHIHSGGIDLLFPHHTNELAQSEAYHGCKEWVNCFIHVGHLHIHGLKMSKSLKNFITIEELLKTYSPRQIRLAFLIRAWDSRLDFSNEIMTQEVIPLEALLNNFFSQVSSMTRDNATFLIGHPFGARERDLRSQFDQAKVIFRDALSDSMNTVSAINAVRRLVSQTHIYINTKPATVDCLLILGIARWISQMLRMFGLASEPSSDIGWEVLQSQGDDGHSTSLPYLQALSSFRDTVRKLAKEKSPSLGKELLALSDQLRDDILPPLGIQLGDRADGPALIKFVSPGLSGSVKTSISKPQSP